MPYKPVKNVNKPGRPPKNSAWVKDAEGNIKRNEQGLFEYRELSAEEAAAAKGKRASKKAAKKGPKGKRGRKPKAEKTVVAATGSSKLTNKGTYKALSFPELEKIQSIVGELLAHKKDSERADLQKQLQAIQSKLASL